MNYLLVFLKEISNYLFEPITSLTDLILSISCFYFFFAIRKFKNINGHVNNWSRFFLFLGVSTLLGSILHATPFRNNNSYNTLWVLMQLLSGLSVFFAQSAAFRYQISNLKVRKVLIFYSWVQLLIFLPCVFYFFNFKVVAVNSLITLIQLIIIYFPTNKNEVLLRSQISFGFLISFGTFYVNHKRLSAFVWLKHNDIAHLIMYISVFLVFRGIKYKHHSETIFQ